MFCQKCGAAEQSANAYCKRCGEWLLNSGGSASRQFLAASPEQMTNKILFLSGLGALFGIVSAVALYITFFSGDRKFSIAMAAAFCLVISVYQAVTFLNSFLLRQRLKRGRAYVGQIAEQHVPVLNAADAGSFAPSSVSERTTELLETVPRVREQRK
jgi:hypothetical protein